MADIRGTSDDDTLNGTDENDDINGLSGNDILNGGAGDDELNGGTGDDILNGDEGNDTLRDTIGNNQLSGGTGNDELRTGSGDDFLDGGAGDDDLDSGFGDDTLFGGDGDDVLDGGFGNDLLIGEAGADEIDGGFGPDDVDLVSYFLSDAGVTLNFETEVFSGGHAEGDTISGVEAVEASIFDDTIIGSSDVDIIFGLEGDDTVVGGSGDDFIEGGAGADDIDGGAGFNLVAFRDSLSGVTVNLETGVGSLGDAEGDSYTNISDISGSDFADILTGDSEQNFLFGFDGDDVLTSGANFDLLVGGGGDDTLIGDGTPSLSLTSIEGQIFRAYQAVFDRAPDLGGFNLFSNELRAGNQTQEDVIAEFVASQEFQNTYGELDNGAFMEQLFLNVLDREGDPAGIEAFTNELDAGRSRASVVAEFANSAEFVQLMTLPSASFATNVIIHPAEGQVFRIYQAVFDRAPDAEGFTAFVNSLQAGALTPEAITAEFVASQEFQNTYGDLTNEAFVETLYTNVLPGNTDAAGRAAFISALDAETLTRAEMVAEFAESQELRNTTADAADAFVASVFETSADTLVGGEGNDILFGGRGADEFEYNTQADGQDTILDFTSGTDRIVLEVNSDFESFAEILAAGTQDALNTVFDFGGGNTLTFENTTLSDLIGEDFGFDTGGSAKSTQPDVSVIVMEPFTGEIAAFEAIAAIEGENWITDLLL